MKVNLKYGISTYSGTIDEITFSSYREGTICIARKWVKPRATEQNAKLGSIASNLAQLYADISEGYKADLKQYALLYGRQKADKKKLYPSAYALYIKMLFTFAEDSGENVDLASITLNDIQTLYVDLSTVAEAVSSGYLPNVSGADALSEAI